MENISFVIRSFVRRESRITKSQQDAIKRYWPVYGIEQSDNEIDLVKKFGNSRPIVLDIGFGNGEALAILAEQNPSLNFLGVEVYRPGIGSLLKRIKEKGLENILVANLDVVDFLQRNITDNCIATVLIWFPDPWPKKRHHKRRLIKSEFIRLLELKIISGGELYMVTDWQSYAEEIQFVLKKNESFKKAAECKLIVNRPKTKFERRGEKLGHNVFSQVYRRIY